MRLILRIRQTFTIWVRPPGRSIADVGGGEGDLSDNLNAATPSGWKRDQDALRMSLVSEMYPTVVICIFWAWDFFWVAPRFLLPCHIYKTSWTLAIVWNFLSAAFFFISESFSVFYVSKSGWAPTNIPTLIQANCLTTTCLQRVSPGIVDWLQQITSRARETLPSTQTPCGMIGYMSCATFERLADFGCISFCCCHQSVMPGNKEVLLISTGSEW